MCECVPANERGRRSFQTTFSANLVTVVTPGARTRRAAGLVTGYCGCETHRLLMLARGTFSHFPRCDKSAVPFAGTAGICNTPSRSLNKVLSAARTRRSLAEYDRGRRIIGCEARTHL